MATAAMDRSVRVWDIRNGQRCLSEMKMPYAAAGNLRFSDRKMLAAVVGGDTVEFYRDVCTKPANYPYMRHKVSLHIDYFQIFLQGYSFPQIRVRFFIGMM